MDPYMEMAITEARAGAQQGGIPIGSVLVKAGQVVGKGHNRRVQDDDPMTHAEIACLRNAGRIGSYRDTVLYSTLMPCYMCAGTVVQFGIPKVIVGESITFKGARSFMEAHGVEVIDLADDRCIAMMKQFIECHPDLWHEDIGK